MINIPIVYSYLESIIITDWQTTCHCPQCMAGRLKNKDKKVTIPSTASC